MLLRKSLVKRGFKFFPRDFLVILVRKAAEGFLQPVNGSAAQSSCDLPKDLMKWEERTRDNIKKQTNRGHQAIEIIVLQKVVANCHE